MALQVICKIRYLSLLVIAGFFSCNMQKANVPNINHNRDSVSQVEVVVHKDQYRTVPGKEFNMGGMGMNYSVLYKDKQLIDTIDADVGFYIVGSDSVVFLEVEVWNDEQEGLTGVIKAYILLNNHKRTILKDLLPYFDDYFSSPLINDSKLYYWGIKHLNDEFGTETLYAVKYDLKTSQLDSIFLTHHLPEGTDDMWYYSLGSENKNDLIYLLSYNEEWIIDMETFTIKNKNFRNEIKNIQH